MLLQRNLRPPPRVSGCSLFFGYVSQIPRRSSPSLFHSQSSWPRSSCAKFLRPLFLALPSVSHSPMVQTAERGASFLPPHHTSRLPLRLMRQIVCTCP